MNRSIRRIFPSLGLLGILFWCGPQQFSASAQTRTGKPAAKKPVNRTFGEAIALARSAGPATIGRHATIIGCEKGSCADMNELAKGPARELGKGTNDWACYALKDGPMCLDRQWQKWMAAWISKSEVKIAGTGIGYMLQGD